MTGPVSMKRAIPKPWLESLPSQFCRTTTLFISLDIGGGEVLTKQIQTAPSGAGKTLIPPVTGDADRGNPESSSKIGQQQVPKIGGTAQFPSNY
jgi:hypothetical protein